LTLFNGELYGTTESGGNSGTGTIFKISTNGTGYTIVYHLTYYGGSYPVSGVVADGGVLYGVARYGGAFGYGAVYRVNPDGSAYTNLHDFTALANNTNGDGVYPYGRLVVTNGWIYGAALDGGPAGSGMVFALTTTGTVFTNLHNFSALVSSTNAEGAYPQGGLVLVGNRLYGTTTGGGASGQGTVYAVNTDGGGFARLHDFAYGVGNGAYAYAGLLSAKGRLYGTTYYGGDNGYGTVFSIGLDGSNYGNLYSFDFAAGAYPYCPVTISGNLLYGTAYGGGDVGSGAVFSLGLTAPILRIQRPGGVPVLSWDDPTFVLQSAPALGGTYTNVPSAASPYTNPVTGSRKFFRLMGN
jgi:uncharacterized repeat protein (TIGR03803 family)